MNKSKLFGFVALLGILGLAYGAWRKMSQKVFADMFFFFGLFALGIGLVALAWLLFDKTRQ